MSIVNNALSQLAAKDKQAGREITKAVIPELKKSKPIAWLMGGFAISMAVGGWAVSQQQPSVDSLPVTIEVEPATTVTTTESAPSIKVSSKFPATIESPTRNTHVVKDVNLYETPSQPLSVATNFSVKPKAEPVEIAEVATTAKAKSEFTRATLVTQALPSATLKEQPPVLIKKVSAPAAEEGMVVEQVELSPRELADKSIARAEKAINGNDVQTALSEYHRALRLVPTDEPTRQKLAALYYGKKDVRKSVDLLQQGIKINEHSQALRMALSKLLLREDQPEAALTPLIYTSNEVSEDYLALRAGIAQKIKNNPVALESYLSLVESNPENARWWLGLAIQQERNLEYDNAKLAYTNALGRVGISSKTQAFIRDRLQLLATLEGTSNGN